jgi:WD40 repeat protein
MVCFRMFLVGAVASLLLTLASSASGDEPIPLADEGPRDYRAKYAIIIGINKYKGAGLEPLLFAENDAREVRNTLQDEFGYSPDRIFFLTDDGATCGAVRRVLEEEIARREPEADDSLLLFFAGHGLIDRRDGETYLALADSKADDLRETGLAVSWVRDRFGGLKCRHKLIILDCCYSGSLFRSIGAPDGVPQGPTPRLPGARGGDPLPGADRGRPDALGPGVADNLPYYLSRPAFEGMSAGRFTPVADGLGENRHSVFTSALLKVMEERANSPRRDQSFTFRQLATQVETRVANALGSHQVPDWGRLGPGDGDFLFRATVRRKTPDDQRREQQALSHLARSLEARVGHELLAAKRHAVEALGVLDGPEVRRQIAETWYTGRLVWQTTTPTTTEARADDLKAGPRPTCVAFARDGRRLLTGDDAGRLWIWDDSDGRLLGTIDVGAPVLALAIAPDGRTIAIGCRDERVRLWDLEARAPARRYRLSGAVLSLDFSKDGRYLAVGASGDGMSVLDLATGERIEHLTHHNLTSHAVRFARQGRSILWAGERFVFLKSLVGLRNIDAGKQSESVLSVAWREDPPSMATAGGDRIIQLWNQSSAKEESIREIMNARAYTMPGMRELRGHEESILKLAFSTNGKSLLSASEDGTARLWHAESGEPLLVLRAHTDAVIDAAFSPDGAHFATLGRDRRLCLWRLPEDLGPPLYDRKVLPGYKEFMDYNKQYTPHTVAFADKHTLVDTVLAGETHVWDLRTGARSRTSNHEHHGDPMKREFDLSPTGTRMVSLGLDELTVFRVDRDDEPIVLRIEGVSGAAWWDESTLVVGRSSGAVALFDLGSRGVVRELGKLREGVRELAVGRTSRRIAAATESSELAVWDQPGRPLGPIPPVEGKILHIALSPDGRCLAIATMQPDPRVTLWLVDEARVAAVSKQFARTVAFDPRSRWLATGAQGNGEIRLLDARNGREAIRLAGHTQTVQALAFSPGGDRLASGSWDGDVRIWTIDKLERLLNAEASDLAAQARQETGLILDGLDVVPKPARSAQPIDPGRLAELDRIARRGGQPDPDSDLIGEWEESARQLDVGRQQIQVESKEAVKALGEAVKRSLALAEKDRSAMRLALSCRVALGDALSVSDATAESQEAYRRALDDAATLVRREGDGAGLRPMHEAASRLAAAYQKAERNHEAIAAYRKAVDAHLGLPAAAQSDRLLQNKLAENTFALADLLGTKLERWDDALPWFASTLKIRQEVFLPSDDVDALVALASASHMLAGCTWITAWQHPLPDAERLRRLTACRDQAVRTREFLNQIGEGFIPRELDEGVSMLFRRCDAALKQFEKATPKEKQDPAKGAPGREPGESK